MPAIAGQDVSANSRRTAVGLLVRQAFFTVVINAHQLLVSCYTIAHLPEPALVAATVDGVDVEACAIGLVHAGQRVGSAAGCEGMLRGDADRSKVTGTGALR